MRGGSCESRCARTAKKFAQQGRVRGSHLCDDWTSTDSGSVKDVTRNLRRKKLTGRQEVS